MIKPQTLNQENYIRCITENTVTVCIGPAGVGKSTIPAALAAEYLTSRKIERIIVTRPIIEAGRGLGFLPGNVIEKTMNYMIPVMHELEKWLTKELLDQIMKDGRLEILAPEFMRGRNLNEAFVICDEAQNMSYSQIMMLITRIGKKSKLVISGDPTQSDLRENQRGALEIAHRAFSKDDIKDCCSCELTKKDIVRNKIIGPIINALNDEYNKTFPDGGGIL